VSDYNNRRPRFALANCSYAARPLAAPEGNGPAQDPGRQVLRDIGLPREEIPRVECLFRDK